MSDAVPHIALKSPIKILLEAGKTYFWCRCGDSKSQPLCDGSHRGGAFRPLAHVAEATEEKWFCACKHTGGAPMCDGTHRTL